MTLWQAIADEITRQTGDPVAAERHSGIGGGCINDAFRIDGQQHRYFVKTNHANRLSMFEAEADGLTELSSVSGMRVPAPVCCGTAGDTAFIAMEYIEMGGSGKQSIENLGAGVAEMHEITRTRFGWHRDNTIGSTHQRNTQTDDWVSFFQQHRLGFQLELAAHNGYRGKLQSGGEKLLERLPEFFTAWQPAASLLHGDLWSGNYAISSAGDPVIFDPAVYYGDREADIAMTELFGGFSPRFYDAYQHHLPLDAGYATRKTLYNLYHILNHLNIFGDGYLGQAQGMIDRLLSELR